MNSRSFIRWIDIQRPARSTVLVRHTSMLNPGLYGSWDARCPLRVFCRHSASLSGCPVYPLKADEVDGSRSRHLGAKV
jgi:hypothetical protein